MQGFGFFQNVGRTRRQGVETEVTLKSRALQLYASYAFVDARFLDALQVGSNSPFADENGNIQILPGNQVPAVPRHRVKAGFDYAITDAFKVGADATFVSSQYFVGDESNQAAKLTSYAVANVHASYQIDKTFQIYGRIDNSLTTATRLTARSSRPTLCPISPTAARRSPTPIGQPGAAARVLCRIEGDFLAARAVLTGDPSLPEGKNAKQEVFASGWLEGDQGYLGRPNDIILANPRRRRLGRRDLPHQLQQEVKKRERLRLPDRQPQLQLCFVTVVSYRFSIMDFKPVLLARWHMT